MPSFQREHSSTGEKDLDVLENLVQGGILRGRVVVDIVTMRNVFMTPGCYHTGFEWVWHTGVGTSTRRAW
jgi:hypothetical protein